MVVMKLNFQQVCRISSRQMLVVVDPADCPGLDYRHGNRHWVLATIRYSSQSFLVISLLPPSKCWPCCPRQFPSLHHFALVDKRRNSSTKWLDMFG